MFGKLLDKDMIAAIKNAPKMCREMESKRIDMTALEFMCAVPIVVQVLDLSKKEQMGAVSFASAIVSLSTSEEGKKLLEEPLQKFKKDVLADFAQTEIPPENTEKAKENEPASEAAQVESEKSKLPEALQELLDDPDVPEKIKKAIMAAADVDADIEIIRVKGKKG